MLYEVYFIDRHCCQKLVSVVEVTNIRIYEYSRKTNKLRNIGERGTAQPEMGN